MKPYMFIVHLCWHPWLSIFCHVSILAKYTLRWNKCLTYTHTLKRYMKPGLAHVPVSLQSPSWLNRACHFCIFIIHNKSTICNAMWNLICLLCWHFVRAGWTRVHEWSGDYLLTRLGERHRNSLSPVDICQTAR